MKNPNIVDNKLLIVFEAVMRERSLTRAAQYLGTSQPAISFALRKLRHILDDTLFVRIANGVSPTPRALELSEPIHELLNQYRTVFEPAVFSPGKARHTIRIASSNQGAALVLPKLYELLRAQAPGIAILVRPAQHETYIQQLDGSEIHVAIGMMQDIPPRIPHVRLFQDKFVCVMRAGHPLAGRKLTLKSYVAADHIAMSNTNEIDYLLDNVLVRRGIRRRITMTVNQSLIGPLYLKNTDAIITMQSKTVRDADGYKGFHVSPLPFDIGSFDVQLAWPKAFDQHPAHMWVRKQIVDIASEFQK